jgi:Neocarzinostatin family
MRVRSRLAVRVAVVGVTLGAVAIPLAATQAHAAGAAVTLSASTSLTNGEKITVSGTGFTPNAGVSILVCSAIPSAATPPPECDITNVAAAATDGSGAFAATDFTVKAGAIGNGTCPGKAPADQCYLAVSDQTQAGTVLTPIGFAPYVVAKPATNIKTNQTVAITGYGFPAKKQTAYILECGLKPSKTACDTTNVVFGATDANGNLTAAKIKVHIGKVGDQVIKPGGSALVSVVTDITGKIPDSSGAAVITFSKTQPVAPTKTSIKLGAKVKGSKVLVAGVIKGGSKGVAGLKVTVLERAKGHKGWTKAKTVVSKAGGAFSVGSLKHLGHAEQYQAVHAKQTLKGKVYSASASSVVTVK